MIEEPVRVRLKRLREAAGMGYREMATALGMTRSAYGHYEDRYKEPYLPMDFAIQVADVLEREKGVDRSIVLALAGSAAPIEGRTLEERLQSLSLRRQRNLLDLLNDLEAAEALDRGDPGRGAGVPEKEL